ncbi:VTT domain-containing protein (plasmid) [Photobacterium sp. GJ3]|uniref:DedA family protein n=1 Tax=Photobacterium sp. GJ3 TaxID=2829502 RepID=UPI001B8C44A3|nr:VTT domain-containing protein [Photobacterium sp. GJ3]QUJ69512.1 VTT domain-containing protein [Photobacterium sp. GJ3]
MLLFFGIIVLSYLLEDVAITTAALLSGSGSIPVSLALLAVFIGIASGDLMLFLLGRYARRWDGLRRKLLRHHAMHWIQHRLESRPFLNIFLLRYTPGLRTIGFTLCGYLSVRPVIFCSAVLVATALWTAVIFTLFYHLSQLSMFQNSPLKWLLLPVVFVLFFFVNRRSSNQRKSSCIAGSPNQQECAE